MKVEPTNYSGWNNYPTYRVRSFNDFVEISQWMGQNNVENFLLSSGSTGYTFQVKNNHDWFVLKWL
jgi:hypothetical protein